MGREKRWSVLLLALVLFTFFGGETAWAAETPVVRAQAAVLINADTGQVLFEKNARRRMEPASLTKIMTCLLAMEGAAPEEPVTVTAEAVQLMQDAAAIGLLEGETLTVAQLLYATMLPSANDAAAAIGIHLEGSTAAFAEAMNRRTGELGLTGTHFSNAHGLPAADHYSTAWDLAQITRAALDYPEFLSYAGRPSYTIPASTTNRAYSFGHLNHALTLGSGSFDRRAIAGKTGWTRSAGSCLMTVAEQNGVRLIAVILKEDSQASGGNIYRDTKALFDYGFSAFRPVTVPLVGKSLPVFLEEGGQEYSLAVPGGTWQVLVPLSLTAEELTLEVSAPAQGALQEGGSLWGEVLLLEKSTKKMLLRAGRVPLSGQIMALEPLGPSAATLEVARDEERDRGDIPLAVGASLLLVLLLAAANRKNRELVPPVGPLTQEEKEQGHPAEEEAASLRQM
ncbi:MAG: D-alanyl-D-alanine carboxypeptidase [Angelakisella sp.]|nr:D-alanyl-D-alanine carboxypeptidase [Angelakisella sp.]